MSDSTRFEKIVNAAKDNLIVAVVGVIIVATVTISQFSESILEIINTFDSNKSVVAEISVHNKDVSPLDNATGLALLGNPMGTSSLLVSPVLDVKIVNNSNEAVFIKSIHEWHLLKRINLCHQAVANGPPTESLLHYN